MSNQNITYENQNQNQNQNQIEEDEVDRALNELPDFVRLPQSDGESITVQFSKDKTKRRVITRTFKDPQTGEERKPTKRIEYKVTLPMAADHGEKSLEAPMMLARQIEDNLKVNHSVLRIIRHGTGLKTTYTTVAAG